MTHQKKIGLVKRYIHGVDQEDFGAISETLTDDCVFTVETHDDGSQTHKSNCNFFEIRGGRFSHIAVYMTGENTLNST